MTATLLEKLGDLSRLTLELDWDPGVVAKAVRGSIVRVYDGQRLLHTGVLLTRTPAEKAIVLGAFGLDWLLGSGDSGPLIESREYLACTDKLANGDFGLADLYYRFGQDTEWAIAPGPPAVVGADSNVDDILESDEVFITAPGREYHLTVRSQRPSGTVGRLRARSIYEGRFSRPNLLPNGDLELGAGNGWGSAPHMAVVDDPAHARSGTKVIKADPLPQPQALVNGDFEAGDVNWAKATNTLLDPVSAIINDPSRSRTGDHVLLMGSTRKRACYNGDFEAWTAGVPDGWHDATADFSLSGFIDQSSVNRSGNSSVEFTTDGSLGHNSAAIEAISPPENYDGSHSRLTRVAEGERWRFLGFCANDIAASPPTDFHAWAEIRLLKEDFVSEDLVQGVFNEVIVAFNWRLQQHEFNVSPGFTRMGLRLFASNVHGSWYWDDVTLERIEGNEEIVKNDPVSVNPGDEWTLTVMARSGPAFLSGGLFPRVRLRGVKTVTNKALASNVATLTIGTHAYTVGQKVAVSGVDATFDGTWVVTAVTGTTISYAVTHADVASTAAAGTAGNPDILSELNPVSQTNNQWVATGKAVTIPDGYDTAIVELRGRDIEGDWIYVDDCTFIRTKGNSDSLTHDAITLVPGRTYRLRSQIRSGPKTVSGALTLACTLSSPGRDDIQFEASQDPTGDTYQELALGFSPASGYDQLTLVVRSDDLLGDSFYVDEISIVDEDDPKVDFNKTFVEDLVIADAALGDHVLDTTAPDGAQKIHVQLVAESLGGGWEVEEWHLQRVGTPATVADIVDDLLRDDQGRQLLEVGTVHDADALIVHDWELANLHNRDALLHLLSGGVAADLREYRVRPNGQIDVGTAGELYQPRPKLVLTAYDVVVIEPPDTTVDDSEYFSHVKVVGAERQTVNGDTVTITATVAVPWPSPLLDAGGIAVRRTKVVTDSSANHPLYAQALATSTASDMVSSLAAVTLRLGDLRAWGIADVGDWIFPYVPDAGFEDRSNPMVAADGSPAFPEKIRLVERALHLGDGYRATVTPPGAEPIDITDRVRWEDMTMAELTVGTFVPTFTVDDQGGAALKQFLRYRASAAR